MASQNVSPVRRQIYRSLAGESQGTDSANRDARFERQLREYVSGITRQRRWLNHIIDASYSGKRSLDDRVRAVLQIGLYDLLFMSTPDYAAINDAVQLAKSEVNPRVGGVVNAILRKVQREGVPPVATGSTTSDLGITYSHPDWIVGRWLTRYGTENTRQLLEYANTRPTYSVRVNRLRTTPDEFREKAREAGASLERARYSKDFFYTSDLQTLLRSELFTAGLFSVQDESAGLVVDVIDAVPGTIILDLCAAPGGKTAYLAEQTEGKATIIAADRSGERLSQVGQSIDRLGLQNVRTVVADGTRPEDLASIPAPDIILIDAPCSGLGVLSKRADLRWNRSEKQFGELTELQDKLLRTAAAVLKPGGTLVYSTCTIEPEENEERIQAFLAGNSDMELEDVTRLLPDSSLVVDGMYRTLPFDHGIDGAFAARMIKR